jgi:hypothetical protein
MSLEGFLEINIVVIARAAFSCPKQSLDHVGDRFGQHLHLHADASVALAMTEVSQLWNHVSYS